MERPGLRAVRIFFAALVLGVSGCSGCWCSNAFEAMTDSPSDSLIEREVRKRLATERETASSLCGIPIDGLIDVEVKVVSQTMGSGTVHVSGVPVFSPDAAPEAKLEVKKALLCAGVIAFLFSADLGADGKRVGWKLAKFELESVETEGVEFHPSRHRRHHHH